MARVSFEQFSAGKPIQRATTSAPITESQTDTSTVRSRLAEVGEGNYGQIKDALTGQGQYQGQNSLTRGIGATATAFSTVPEGALALAPKPVREGVEVAGEVIGKGFKALTDLIGSNKQLQDWTQAHPEATSKIMEVAQGTGDLGAIAGTIAGAKGTAGTLSKGADIVSDVTKLVSKNADEAFGNFGALRPTVDQVAKERGDKIRSGFEEQNTRLKSADKAYNQNTIVRKLPDGTEKTITPIDTFADNGISPVIEKGSIQMGDYKLGTGALGKIKESVQSLDDEIDTKLVNTGQRITLNDLEAKALEAVKNNTDFKQEGTVASNSAKVQARFEDYRMSYGDDIDIAELNNIRKVANRDWKPETQDTSRVVGDVARNYVYDAVPDNEIRRLLQNQGELLAAKKYAEKINGTKVTGGRLGNYAMRTAGAILGSTVDKAPVIGPVVGMLGGEAAARLMQQSQFKSAWTELRSLIAKEEVPTPTGTPKPPTNTVPVSSAKNTTNQKLIDARNGKPNSQGGYIKNPIVRSDLSNYQPSSTFNRNLLTEWKEIGKKGNGDPTALSILNKYFSTSGGAGISKTEAATAIDILKGAAKRRY